MNFTYYHGREAELTAFYRLPKFLFDVEFATHLGDKKGLLKSKEIVYYESSTLSCTELRFP